MVTIVMCIIESETENVIGIMDNAMSSEIGSARLMNGKETLNANLKETTKGKLLNDRFCSKLF